MILLQPLLFSETRYGRTLVVASGLWALVPDLHYLVPDWSAQTGGASLTVLGDVFWFHRTLDGLVTGRGTRPNAALALGFLCVTAFLVDTLTDRWQGDA